MMKLKRYKELIIIAAVTGTTLLLPCCTTPDLNALVQTRVPASQKGLPALTTSHESNQYGVLEGSYTGTRFSYVQMRHDYEAIFRKNMVNNSGSSVGRIRINHSPTIDVVEAPWACVAGATLGIFHLFGCPYQTANLTSDVTVYVTYNNGVQRSYTARGQESAYLTIWNMSGDNDAKVRTKASYLAFKKALDSISKQIIQDGAPLPTPISAPAPIRVSTPYSVTAPDPEHVTAPTPTPAPAPNKGNKYTSNLIPKEP